MSTEEFVINILRAIPEHSITGKKRLQKVAYFLKEGGEPVNAEFRLKNFGPFSSEVESATDLLSIFGDIQEENVVSGFANYLATKYVLSPELRTSSKLSENARRRLSVLNGFNTLDLEIASTIHFFQKETSLEVAVERTKAMKPTKSKEYVINNAKSILVKLNMA